MAMGLLYLMAREIIIQKTTELGVSRIIPFIASRVDYLSSLRILLASSAPE